MIGKMGERHKGLRKKESKLDEVVRQAYINDGKNIEKAIEEDSDYEPDEQEAQELYQRIMTRIETEEAAKETAEPRTSAKVRTLEVPTSAQEHEEFRRAFLKKRRRKKKVGKWVAVVAATLAGVFGMSMTSQANRIYFMDSVNYVIGNRVSMDVDTDSQRESAFIEEGELKGKVYDKAGIEFPIFSYRPDDMKYLNCTIDETMNIVNANYELGGEIVNLFMKKTETTSARNISVHGQKMGSVKILVLDMECTVWEIQNPDEEKPSYLAQWQYNNCLYQFSGKVEKEIFEKILEQIGY